MTKTNMAFIGGFSLLTKILFVALLAQSTIAKAAPAPDSFADLAEKLLPSVVNISSTQKIAEEQPQTRNRPSPFNGQNPFGNQFPKGHPFNDFFDDFFNRHFEMIPPPGDDTPMHRSPLSSLGSGFVINKEKGWIITNNHVIDGADEIKITLHDDTILSAEVLGTDEKTDIALLQTNLQNEDVTAVSFGNSDKMRVGDWIIAIGNPFGLGGTVTAGIISARQRDINSGPYDDYLQTDASINRGNSGGPMFNINGEVIGINTAIFSPTGGSVGIGFAIPSVLAEPVINQLGEFGRTKRGWLGVKIQEVTDEIAESLGLAKAAGALVANITPTGPAEKSGIKTGDIILAFNNQPVREMRNLPRIVAETEIGENVPVIIWRNGQRMTINATVGELEKAEDSGLLAAHDGSNLYDDEPEQEPEGINIPELGLTLAMINDNLRETYNIDDNVTGLVVLDSDVNSDAAKKGVDQGDVIIDINQQPVQSVANLQAKIAEAKNKDRDTILLLINRYGAIQFVAVKIDGDSE